MRSLLTKKEREIIKTIEAELKELRRGKPNIEASLIALENMSYRICDLLAIIKNLSKRGIMEEKK